MAHAPAPDEAPDFGCVARTGSAGRASPTAPVPHYVPSGVVNATPVRASRGHRVDRRPCCVASRVDRRARPNRALRTRIWCHGLGRSISQLPSLALVGAACDRACAVSPTHCLESEVNWPALLYCGRATAGLAGSVGLVQVRESTPTSSLRLTGDPARAGLSASPRSARVSRTPGAWLLPGWGVPEPSWLRTHPATAERWRACRLFPPPAMPPFPARSTPK